MRSILAAGLLAVVCATLIGCVGRPASPVTGSPAPVSASARTGAPSASPATTSRPLEGALPGAPGAAGRSEPAAATPPAATPAATRYVRVEWSALPGWQVDRLDALDDAIRRQCVLPAARASAARLCAAFAARGSASLRDWIERELEPYAIEAIDAEGSARVEGLITGYHEPLLRGSRRAGGRYGTPLHRRPADLLAVDLRPVAPQTADLRLRGRLDGVRVVPYFDRAQIETRAPLAGRELLWVDDPVEAFFLHVQGSGRVRLDDGSTVRVAYADQNGHPYKPIGRVLIERGLLTREQADAAGIKAWLRANPALRDDVMRANPSYVFFAEEAITAADVGPRGSLGVPLTPQRSVAVDPRFVPLGTLVYLDTPHPSRAGRLAQAYAAQDTGGAIRGAPRADVFWGAGEAAERDAGRMRSNGRMWLLWPRGEPLPAAAATR